jgi:hypothetical protein
LKNLPFLPATREEIDRLGWTQVDVVLVTGDAYVDHPSFGAAVIGRALEHGGCRVAVLAMPPWRDPGAAMLFGRPRLFFRSEFRQRGFDAFAMDRLWEGAQRRSLRAGRHGGAPPRARRDPVLQYDSRILQGRADRHRRNRGFHAPPCPL